MNKDTAIKQYMHDIRAQLFCEPYKKKTFLDELNRRIEDFADTQTSSVEYSMLIEQFGDPKDVADSFIRQSDPAVIRHFLLGKQRFQKRLLIACLIMLTAVFGITTYKVYLSDKLASDYIMDMVYEDLHYNIPKIKSANFHIY